MLVVPWVLLFGLDLFVIKTKRSFEQLPQPAPKHCKEADGLGHKNL